ncbi:hypothetical protein D9M71_364750 [compost metagenome]
MPAGQGRICPPLVLLELHEGGGQVAVELVVGVLLAGFELLLVNAGSNTNTPGVIQAVAAAQGQVVAMAIGAGGTALAVDIQILPTSSHDCLPLANRLPVALPLVAQFILVRAQAGVGHFW